MVQIRSVSLLTVLTQTFSALRVSLLLSIFVVLLSCKGQTTETRTRETKEMVNAGDTVKTLCPNIMVVYQSKAGHYWFGSWEEGAFRYDGQTLLHFTTKQGLPANRIEEIREDQQGNIFFNTAKGICKFNGQAFTTLYETLPRDSSWHLHPADLWFKCPQYPGQVYRYDGQSLYRLPLPKLSLGETYRSEHPGHITPYDVYCVYKGRDNAIWFGTAALGVCRYNGKAFHWITEEDVTELHNGPSNGVRSIIEDREGYLWFNSRYRYRIDTTSKINSDYTGERRFYTRHQSIGSLDGKKDGTLFEYLSITRDTANTLWIATYRDGVWHYDGKTISHHVITENGETIPLFYIYSDTKGKIWLGTHRNGAYYFDGKRFVNFTP